ncbi:MAG: hypothetical protein LBM56_05370 [Burkholderiaceae bacterium]|jgi:hypothetical protein|nr:hypothetical protein [Burkholderiaceae bacterium]
MTDQDNNKALPEQKALIDDSALDATSESEGGFPCGEFLWDEEEDAPPAIILKIR